MALLFPKSNIVLPTVCVVLFAVLIGNGAVTVRNQPTQQTEPAASKPFEVVVLPDTQYYSQRFPYIFEQQTKWIVRNQHSRNIVYVTHLGDIVEDWDNETQWQAASQAMQTLDGHVPYGIAPGNHDMSPSGESPFFESYFPQRRIAGATIWAPDVPGVSASSVGFGSFGTKNNYRLFGGGGQRFIAINLEFCPTDEDLIWASKVLHGYSDRQAIIVTHSFLNADGVREVAAKSCAVYNHEGMNAGADIWNYLIEERHHTNILLFLNGHDIWSGVGASRRTDTVAGRPVYQLMSDYQMFGQGGNGYFRVLDFDYAAHELNVKTYSPYLNTYITGPENQFQLPLPHQ